VVKVSDLSRKEIAGMFMIAESDRVLDVGCGPSLTKPRKSYFERADVLVDLIGLVLSR
jgi:hypothetical protein